jgi:hypothetical protein
MPIKIWKGYANDQFFTIFLEEETRKTFMGYIKEAHLLSSVLFINDLLTDESRVVQKCLLSIYTGFMTQSLENLLDPSNKNIKNVCQYSPRCL